MATDANTSPAELAIDSLLDAVGQGEPVERERALATLRSLGSNVADRVLNHFDRATADHEPSVVDVLHGFGPAILPLLLAVSADLQRRPASRRGALQTLAAFADLLEQADAIVSHLVTRLADPDPYVAAAVLRALRAFGERAGPAVPALVPLLETSRRRDLVVSAITATGPVLALPIVRGLLHDENWHIRELADDFIRKHTPQEPIAERVRRGMQSPDDEVRRTAIQMLTDFIDEVPDALEHLQQAWLDPSSSVRIAALRLSGDPSLPDGTHLAGLRRALHDEEGHVRTVAVNTVCDHAETFAGELLTDLLPLFADADPQVRVAIATLANWQECTPAIQRAVADLLDDPEEDVRNAAVRVLPGHLAMRPELVPTLLRHMHTYEGVLAPRVAWLLAGVRPTSPEVTDELAAFFRREPSLGVGPLVRVDYTAVSEDRLLLLPIIRTSGSYALSDALALLLDLGPAIVPELVKLTDVASPVRLEVIRTLGRLTRSADIALPILTDLLSDPDATVRRATIRSVAAIAAPADAVQRLRVGLRDWKSFIRGDVLEALAGLGRDALTALPDIVDLVRGEADRGVMHAAIALLTELRKHSSAVDEAVRSLLAEGGAARDNARWVLSGIGTGVTA